MATVHIVGAGLAGLSCAVALIDCGHRVTLIDAAPQAGGRCRSFHDDSLERRIDNGNHLLLSANRRALAYLHRIGAGDSVTGPRAAAFPFHDLASGERWLVRMNAGPVPWWVVHPGRRVPGTRLRDYAAAVALLRGRADQTIADLLDRNTTLYQRFWEPLILAVMNTPPEHASAGPMRRVLWQTVVRGGGHCRPLVSRYGLGDSFVDPALVTLRRAGMTVTLGRRVRRLGRAADGRIDALELGDETVTVDRHDTVVLALPPTVVAELMPDLPVPTGSMPILNAHFRLACAPAQPFGLPFLGLINATAQWVFFRNDVVSVTVSGASALIDRPAADLAARLWSDVARTLGLANTPVPPARIIKERRATFAQTPANMPARPGAVTPSANLFLAGDWTDTGLPATIEGAIRSGETAAAAVLDPRRRRALS